jgi:DNA-binding NarL/FixJ family response regulator
VSDRERRCCGSTPVLRQVADGRSNVDIADTLVIIGGTVEKRIAAIFAKVGLPRRSATIARSTPFLP